MKERPIIMQAESARDILDGRKTQTRRVAKYNPFLGEPSEWGQRAKDQDAEFARIAGDYRRFCPHGQPGDRLWVKEAFYLMPHLNAKSYFRATDPLVGVKWKSPLFMPRCASRITLELVNVRVERVQDISEADVWEEGCAKPSGYFGCPGQAQTVYKQVWQSIHGKNPARRWEANPWVWVLEFKRLDA